MTDHFVATENGSSANRIPLNKSRYAHMFGIRMKRSGDREEGGCLKAGEFTAGGRSGGSGRAGRMTTGRKSRQIGRAPGQT